MISAAQIRHGTAVAALLLCFALLCAPAWAEQEPLPPEVTRGVNLIFSGDPDAAIPLAKHLQKTRPEHPLGYLLQLEALWWKDYCEACEVKWGMVDAWNRSKKPDDDEFIALADKSILLAKAQIAQSDSANMHLYAGMAYAFKTRLYALRDEHRAVARNGVAARAEFIRALDLDPELYDADAGLGIYNYYADALSAFVKILRFFMGIPGGNKKAGIEQLELAMEKGRLMKVEARFYLARNLRTYDQKYESAEEVLLPLEQEYPGNPLFHLLIGNLNVELGRTQPAIKAFKAAENSAFRSDSQCSAHLRQIAGQFLQSLK